jgi:transcriptional regulator with XRE-family HTH domain
MAGSNIVSNYHKFASHLHRAVRIRLPPFDWPLRARGSREAKRERYFGLGKLMRGNWQSRHRRIGAGRTMLVITRQIRAARSLARWEQTQLALNAGIAISTVRRLEGLDGPISANHETIERIETAFERVGVEFIGNPNPGVRIMSHLDEDRDLEDGRSVEAVKLTDKISRHAS